jgi:hypothetical protein
MLLLKPESLNKGAFVNLGEMLSALLARESDVAERQISEEGQNGCLDAFDDPNFRNDEREHRHEDN